MKQHLKRLVMMLIKFKERASEKGKKSFYQCCFFNQTEKPIVSHLSLPMLDAAYPACFFLSMLNVLHQNSCLPQHPNCFRY